MKKKANSGSTEIYVMRKAAGLQNIRKRQEGEESKVHTYMVRAWQVSLWMLVCLLMAQGDYFRVALGFYVGLIVGLSTWTKVHPSRRFMGFLLVLALAGLFSAHGALVSF